MLLLFSVSLGSFSWWWVPLSILLGIFYAWFLYRRPTNLHKNLGLLLGAFRAVTVAIILLLLLSPLIKSVINRQQKPLVLILQDNSSSVKLFEQPGFDASAFVIQLEALKKKLAGDYDVREFNFAADLKDGLSTSFYGKQTDISAALNGLNERFSNQNIGAIVLATDGLFNKGAGPQYVAAKLKTNIYTIALGDTVAKRDLLIANIDYNKTAFLGNDFQLEVLAQAYQSLNENIALNITEDGSPVYHQNVPVNANQFSKTIPVTLHAGKKGVHKFTFTIQPIQNEISVSNNTETVYIEVLDVKQKITIVYGGPHPDIGAIKESLDGNRNYDVKVTKLADVNPAKLADNSLVILYQVPATAEGPATPLIMRLNQLKMPLWYIVGAQSDLQSVNSAQKIVQINSAGASMQEVFGTLKPDFSDFTLSDSAKKTIATFPPLQAPFGNYSLPAAQAVLMKQRIGVVETSYPLFAFGDNNGQRIGLLAAEGLWKWRLAEYQAKGNHTAVDELLGQVVQYLTANDNHSRFRVYPAKTVFDDGDEVLFNAELYNESLELVNTPDIRMDIKNKAGKTYSFVFTRNRQSYQLDAGALPPDEYTFSADTKLGSKTYTASGQFAVKTLNAETRQSAADHQLLFRLAKENGGQMLMPSQIDQLPALIRKNDNIKTIVYEDKHYSDLVDLKWVFWLILALLSAEWFIRKREGEV